MTTIVGRIKKGDGLGKKLGYPTANLNYKKKPRISEGSFAGAVLFNKKLYRASIFVGAPKTTGQKYRVEAHLFGFSKRLYGKNLTLFIYKKIRSNKKFNVFKDLKKKVKEDMRRTMRIFRTEAYKKWYKMIKRANEGKE